MDFLQTVSAINTNEILTVAGVMLLLIVLIVRAEQTPSK